jgi:thiopurine S-methyltransferase
MDPDFWHQRWARQEIGFHRSRVHPMLMRHWPSLSSRTDTPVLVPLCGKSLDMIWLADRGHTVVGVELSEDAVRDFFHEQGVTPSSTQFGGVKAWSHGSITLCVGDFFEFEPDRPFPLIFDRAAMVAMPADRRDAYRRQIAHLLAENGSGLLITLEYDQETMHGPPFSVNAAELALDPRLRYRTLEAVDALPDHPGFRQRGLAALTEQASVFEHVVARG